MEENVFKTVMENTSVYWNKIKVEQEVSEEDHTSTVLDYSVHGLKSARLIKQEQQPELSAALKFEEYTSCIKKETNIYDNVKLHKVRSKLKHSTGKTRRPGKLQRNIMKGLNRFTRIIVCTGCGNVYTKKYEYFSHFSTQHFIKQKKLYKTQLEKKDARDINYTTSLNRDADKDIKMVEGGLEAKLQENKNGVQLITIDDIKPSSKDDDDYHMHSHTVEKPFKCNICEKVFPRKNHLTNHIRFHTEKPFKCDICSSAFLQRGELNYHLLRHTGEKPFKCNICSEAFLQKGELNTHMICHTEEKPFSCVVCSKSFSKKFYLKRHVRTHTGEKPFNCDICLKAFSHKKDLTVHLRRHTGEKPFKCDKCLKAFPQSCDLKKHLLTHTGEKPFSCDICLKSFSHECYLRKHAEGHTIEKPFKCFDCLKYFSRQKQLDTHLCHAS